jgi:hypothetical protein
MGRTMTNTPWHYTGTVVGLLAEREYTAVANLAGGGRFDSDSLRKAFAGQHFVRPARDWWNEETTIRRCGEYTILVPPLLQLEASQVQLEFRIHHKTDRCLLHRVTTVGAQPDPASSVAPRGQSAPAESKRDKRVGVEMRVGNVLNPQQINEALNIAGTYLRNDPTLLTDICCAEADPLATSAVLADYDGPLFTPPASIVADLECAVWPDHIKVTLPLLSAQPSDDTASSELEGEAMALLTVRVETATPGYTYCLQDVVATF